MAELTVRLTGVDQALLRRWNAKTAAAGRPAAPWPDRIMIDAPTALACPDLAASARQAGVPVWIDPLTDFWQDHQWTGHRWTELPYATARAASPSEVAAAADRLVAATFEVQLAGGATSLIAPYVHLARTNERWLGVQVELWQATARWRAHSKVALPVLPVLALDWTMLARHRWPAALLTLHSALVEFGSKHVLLAASKVDDGKTASDRLDDLLAVVELLTRTCKVTVLRQGTLGPACVIAGAVGYESGVGWGERCDLRSHMAGARAQSEDGHPVRPKYIAALGQSLAPATLAAAVTEPRLMAAMMCLDPICCPDGRAAFGRDMRDHAVRSRLAALDAVDADHPRWAWRVLAEHATAGLALAERINVVAARHDVNQTRVQALEAISTVAAKRALTAPRRRGVA